MVERFQKDDVPARGEGVKNGSQRDGDFVDPTRKALWFPLAVQSDLADDISPATLEDTSIRFDTAIGKDEAAALAPVAELFANGIRGIDVSEEIEPAFFSRPGKEQWG
jgi:hypothetical protein